MSPPKFEPQIDTFKNGHDSNGLKTKNETQKHSSRNGANQPSINQSILFIQN